MKILKLFTFVLCASVALASCSNSGAGNDSKADNQSETTEQPSPEVANADNKPAQNSDRSNLSGIVAKEQPAEETVSDDSNAETDNTPAEIIECTDRTFTASVISGGAIKCQKPFIIDFNATWCGPCRQLHPVLEKIQSEYGSKIQIFSVDVDECPDASEEFAVEAIPYVLFYNPSVSNKPVYTQEGYLSEKQIKNIISSKMKIN
ncbi:MAG: thioredoxin family protein [Bacteroidales bacterium]|nr:thioredoxin family protein [Bacteroidales bacterium]